MLYARWQEVVAARPDHWALRAGDRQWTFAELDRAARGVELPEAPIVYPQGPEFVIVLLAAWRARRVVCPLEPGQSPPQIPAPPTEIAHLKRTSATTGQFKWVAFTAAQLMADADHIVETMGLRSGWPNVGAISLAHSYGFSNLVSPLLLHGIPLVLADPFPAAIQTVIESGESWTLPGVPALWRAWHEAGALSARVKLAISAGAPLSTELEQAVYGRYGVKLHNFYGATECGGIAYDRGLRPRTDPAEVGLALEGVQLSIGVEGCLEVRGGAVGQSYWPEPDAALSGGCFSTSDLAMLSEGGLRLLGRANDQINVAGRKVLPEVIETKLRSHPAVRDCLVFGVPSGQGERSEVIVACVAGCDNEAALRRHLESGLPAWQVPRHWWFVGALPVNERGKRSRAEYRERFLKSGEWRGE